MPRSHVSRGLALLLRPIHTVLMATYFRVRVQHAERIPKSGPIILTPTHRSRWDTLMLYCAVWGRLLRFLTSHDEIAGYQGVLMRRMGAFPINTRRPTPGALKHCAEILLSGQPLVIFPEGNIFRLPPGEVHPLKPGTAWLALQVQKSLGDTPLTIVPIRLEFSDRFLKFRSRADILVQEPIAVRPYLDRPKDEAIQEITARIQSALGEIVNPLPREAIDALAEGKPLPEAFRNNPDNANAASQA